MNSRTPLRRPARGFTLVEIMVVVVIIGLLAALALPAYSRSARRSQNTRTANDLRVFAQAFETYAAENGGWPANAGAGVVPAGMGGSFRVPAWQAPTALGGRWNWDRDNFGFIAGVSIQNFTVDDAQLAGLDVMIDDGNLVTGRARKVASNRYSYILDED